MITAGKYTAKAVSGAWTKIGEKQTPAIAIKFQTSEGEFINHTMYLTQTVLKNGETVAQKTFNTMAMLGYNEDAELVDGQFGKEHLADKEVQLVVEMEADLKGTGKEYPRVKWVNEIGASKFSGVGVKEVLGGMSLKSEMAAARARTGAKKSDNSDAPF